MAKKQARDPFKASGLPTIAGVVVESINMGALKKARKEGAELLELRIDTFKDRNPLKLKEKIKLAKTIGLPLLLTIRSKKEGGKFNVSDDERGKLFSELASLVDYIDIELSSNKILSKVRELARKNRKKLIISFHDFNSTPGAKRLTNIAGRAREQGADIVKIATMAKNAEHLKRLAALVINEKNIIVVGMGEAGKVSRVFFPMLGSLMTYGSLSHSTAPGQLSLDALKKALGEFTVSQTG